jgi:hypothetical protein
MKSPEENQLTPGQGLPSADLLDAVAEIVEAWTNEGRCPAYHQNCQDRLATEWPTLERAILKLVSASND